MVTRLEDFRTEDLQRMDKQNVLDLKKCAESLLKVDSLSNKDKQEIKEQITEYVRMIDYIERR